MRVFFWKGIIKPNSMEYWHKASEQDNFDLVVFKLPKTPTNLLDTETISDIESLLQLKFPMSDIDKEIAEFKKTLE